MPTEAVSKALRLVEMAKKRKVENIVVGLQDEIEDRRAEAKLTKEKIKSVNHELNTLRNEKSECERNLADLKGLQENLSKEEYEEALSTFSSAVNDYEKKIEEAHASLQRVNDELGRLEAQVGMLSDKQNSLKTDGNGVTAPSSVSEELMAASCRQELQDLYHQCLNLKPYVVQVRTEDPWQSPVRPDSDWSRSMVRVHCMILVGKLKRLQQSCEFNDQEQVIMRRSLGRIGAITKETYCGSVESLKQTAKENWPKYVQTAQAELCRLEAKAAQEKDRLAKKDEPKAEEPSNPDHEKTIEFAVSSGLLGRTKDGVIGIIGGNPGRNEEARRWLEDALQAKQVLWYEDKDSDKMAKSIAAGSMAAVVVMANWIGHKYSDVVTKAAKKSDVPLAMCNQSNRRILVQELANAFGIK